MQMNVMIVEDNFLAAEMMRLAVEDADFEVVGPIATLESGRRVVGSTRLTGALLDFELGDRTNTVPLAYVLQAIKVPLIFVTGHDRSILPEDLRATPLISKPLSVDVLTELAIEHFRPSREESERRPDHRSGTARIAALQIRITRAEERIATQRRRVERLQFFGAGAEQTRLAIDLLDQMVIAVDLVRGTLQRMEALVQRPAAGISRPISDGLIDCNDIGSVTQWAGQLGVSTEELVNTVAEVGPSTRLVARALAKAALAGPARNTKD